MAENFPTDRRSSIDLRVFEAIPGNNVLVKVDPPAFTVLAATASYANITRKTKEGLVGKGIFQSFPGNPNDPADTRERDLRAFKHVITYKEQHHLPIRRYDVPNEVGSFIERFWRVSNTPVLDDEGAVNYIIHNAEDITDWIKAEQGEEKIKGLEVAYNLFMQAPISIHMLKGYDLIIEMANEPTLRYWGRGTEIVGKPLMEALPELEGQGYDVFLREVLRTGQTKEFYEAPVTLQRNSGKEVGYFNFIYKPYYEEGNREAVGVLAVSTEITERVHARKELAENKQTLELAIDIGQLGIYKVDLKTNITTCSEQIMDWYGLTKQHMSMPEIIDKIHPDDQPFVRKTIERSIAKEWGGRHDQTYRVTHPQTRKLYYLRSIGQVQFEKDVPTTLCGIVQDVTDHVMARRKIEEIVAHRTQELEGAHKSLLQANNYLQHIINVFNTPLQVLEPLFENGEIIDFRYKLTNASYAAYANTIPEKIQNKKVGEIFPGYLQTDTFENIAETCRTGKANTWETRYNADGLDLYNEMSATKMDNDVVVHFTDFTKLKNLELDLLRKIEELERSNRNLEEFAYAASHDLKEPIRKIRIFSGRLKASLSDRLTEEESGSFDRLEVAAKRMSSLIEDLLSYSQVSLRPRTFEDVDMNALINLVLGDLDLEIEEKSANIKVDNLFTINGHHRQLQQAFQNLIGNALKYSKPGIAPQINISCSKVIGEHLELHLSLSEKKKEYYAISVSDNGIGFEQKDADLIFDVFTRLHGNAQFQGTGIGLSIVRKVIENHNGYIRAESESGKGATFKVFLPVDNTLGNNEALRVIKS